MTIQTVVPTMAGKGAAYNVNPSTDEQIAVLETWLDDRLADGHVAVSQLALRNLIARIHSAREQAVRECAEVVLRLPSNTGAYIDRQEASAAILSLSQVRAKK